mmetsp:Transcript_14098/g.40204  ORF Transcript_14098/g.40204 Transcript_14098/m.40204 type:complete len:426 (+) Transcript_14098:607-1884(+)
MVHHGTARQVLEVHHSRIVNHNAMVQLGTVPTAIVHLIGRFDVTQMLCEIVGGHLPTLGQLQRNLLGFDQQFGIQHLECGIVSRAEQHSIDVVEGRCDGACSNVPIGPFPPNVFEVHSVRCSSLEDLDVAMDRDLVARPVAHPIDVGLLAARDDVDMLHAQLDRLDGKIFGRVRSSHQKNALASHGFLQVGRICRMHYGARISTGTQAMDGRLGQLLPPVGPAGPDAVVEVLHRDRLREQVDGLDFELLLGIHERDMVHLRVELDVLVEEVGTVASDAAKHVVQHVLALEVDVDGRTIKMLVEGVVKELHVVRRPVGPQIVVHFDGVGAGGVIAVGLSPNSTGAGCPLEALDVDVLPCSQVHHIHRARSAAAAVADGIVVPPLLELLVHVVAEEHAARTGSDDAHRHRFFVLFPRLLLRLLVSSS